MPVCPACIQLHDSTWSCALGRRSLAGWPFDGLWHHRSFGSRVLGLDRTWPNQLRTILQRRASLGQWGLVLSLERLLFWEEAVVLPPQLSGHGDQNSEWFIISRGLGRLGGYRKENSHQQFFSTQRTSFQGHFIYDDHDGGDYRRPSLFDSFEWQGSLWVSHTQMPGAAVSLLVLRFVCHSWQAMIFLQQKTIKKTAQWQVMIFPVGFATIFAVLMGNFINHGLYHSLIDAATSTHSKGIRALEGASIGTYLSNAALVSKSDASFFSQLIIIFHVMNFFPQLWRAVRVWKTIFRHSSAMLRESLAGAIYSILAWYLDSRCAASRHSGEELRRQIRTQED